MRDITTTAAADLYLAQQLARLLQQYDTNPQSGRIHRAKKPGSTASDDDQSFVLVLHAVKIIICLLPRGNSAGTYHATWLP